MYMANAKTLRWGPNTTYIPWAHVGVLRLGVTQILCFALGVIQNLAFLGTNMLVSPKRTFALGQAPNAKIGVSPNATSFASKWNIGFRLRNTQVYYDYKPTPIYPTWSRMGGGGGGWWL